MVVDDDVLVEVVTIRTNLYSSCLWIAGVVGDVILYDKHDMVIVITLFAQDLIHLQHICLMAVIAPSIASSYQQCPLLVKGRVGHTRIILIFEFLHELRFPVPCT